MLVETSFINDKLFLNTKEMTPIRVKAIRLMYRLTQLEFAELIGVKYGTYIKWEGGFRNPSSPACGLLYIAEQSPKAFLKHRDQIMLQVKKLG